MVNMPAAVRWTSFGALSAGGSARMSTNGTAAGMFTISYGLAVVVPVICGALWDLSGAAWTAFVPLAICAVVTMVLGVCLTRYRGASA